MNNKIMVVDDEKMIRSIMEKIFRRNYEVYCAASGKEALEILNDNDDISVFFLDLKMPEMNGIELCKRIKKLNHAACIYAVTGYAPEFNIDWCRDAGFDDCFTKPFSINVVLEAAKEAFAKLERWHQQMMDKE